MNLIRTILSVACIVSAVSAHSFKPYSYAYYYSTTGLWGFINQGNEIVIAQYEDVAPLMKTLPFFWAKKNGKWGMCTSTNSVVIPFEYEDVCVNPMPLQITDSVTIKKPERSTYDNLVKPAINETVSYRHFTFSRGTIPLFPVKKDGKWGYISALGQTVLPFIYDNAYTFVKYLNSDSKRTCWLAGVEYNGQKFYIDMLGNIIGTGDDANSALAPQNGAELRVINDKKAKKYIGKHSKNTLNKYDNQYDALCTAFDEMAADSTYTNVYDGTYIVEEMKAKTMPASRKTKTRKRANRSGNNSSKPQKKYYNIVYGQEPVRIDSVEKVFDREGDAVRYIRNGKYNIINLANGYKFRADSIGEVDSNGYAKYTDIHSDSTTSGGKVNIRGVMTADINYIGKMYEGLEEACKSNNKYSIRAWLSILLSQFDPVYDHQLYAYSNDIDKFIEIYNRTDSNAPNNNPAPKKKESFWDKASRVLDKMNDALNSFADAVSSSETLNAVGNVLNDLSEIVPAEKPRQSVPEVKATSNGNYTIPEEIYDDSSSAGTTRSKKKVEKKKSIPASVWRAYENELNSIGRQLSDYKNKKSNEGLSSSDISRIRSLKKRAQAIRKECREKYGETLPSNSMENWNP